ncbi:MAG: type II toxin-antitoxin system VapC family toxin [Nitrospirae bacterium]|nr:type II toxin-antitoxin system VapC family toxin [Nitrospirota bacterium]
MKYWDSSAIVPLLLEEPTTASLISLYREDPVLLSWWGTGVECVSALARLERTGDLSPDAVTTAMTRLKEIRSAWQEVEPTDRIRETATRLLRVHNLRAADSLQLAAAFAASEGRPPSLDFVCLDERLILAAQREGFPVISMKNP